MNRQRFATLVFQGARFADGVLPVPALPELAAYHELVLSVAKSLYARRNPDRKRLPKGFTDSFQLSLQNVESGSAVPILLRESTRASQLLISRLGTDLFEEARKVLEESIAAAHEEGRPLPPEMPAEALAKFNAFGRTLADDEAIIVAPPDSREGARYTKEIRRRLVLRVQDSFEEPIALIGAVVALNTEPTYSFDFRRYDRLSAKVEVRTSRAFFEKAMKALSEGAVVTLAGTGLFDQRRELTRVTEVSDLSLAEDGIRAGCSVPIDEQVTSFQHLEPGWYGPSSVGYDAADLDWAAGLFKAVVESFDLPNPYVYPTPEGAVRAEWSAYPWDLSVVLDPKARRSEVFATDVSSGNLHENSYVLTAPGSEARMGNFLAQHLHGRYAAA